MIELFWMKKNIEIIYGNIDKIYIKYLLLSEGLFLNYNYKVLCPACSMIRDIIL